MNKSLPDITIMIVTLNNQRTISKCIEMIMKQDYPKERIEYLAVDSGSTDNTLNTFRKANFKIIKSDKKDAEYQRGFGLKHAKNNLIVSLDADNYIPNDNWLRQMILPFIENEDVVCTQTMHYAYSSSDTLYNRYGALFGGVDPVVFYLNKLDRVPRYVKKWTRGMILKQTKDYYLVRFNNENLPTVGCNGVVYRRDIVLKHANSKPDNFLHIDIFADLVKKGFDTFAIVKNDVFHDTALNLVFLMKKRISFLDSYFLQLNKKRRYLIYDTKNPSDRNKLLMFVLYTITIIKPLLDSFRGYIKIPDPAWFLHPIMCITYLISYGTASIKKTFNNYLNI
ncbi:glycosyltransferase [Patescibacteria group bacterium]